MTNEEIYAFIEEMRWLARKNLKSLAEWWDFGGGFPTGDAGKYPYDMRRQRLKECREDVDRFDQQYDRLISALEISFGPRLITKRKR
jgi:hypothetical protein